MFNFFRRSNKQVDPIEKIRETLQSLGYDLLKKGEVVAQDQLNQGYGIVETSSYIALMTMATDVKTNKIPTALLGINFHSNAVVKLLNDYFTQGLMDEEQFKNDITAFRNLTNVNESQFEWVDKILTDCYKGEPTLAVSRIDYQNMKQP